MTIVGLARNGFRQTITLKTVTYEQPLNERIRTFLRLESLFVRMEECLAGSTQWDSRHAMSSLIDILTIFSRSDLKSEILKEIERHTSNLAVLEANPKVDQAILKDILYQLDLLNDRMHAIEGQIAQSLRHNEFLNSVRQRSSVPGGSCDFDLPAYHHWLQKPVEERHALLKSWYDEFSSSVQSIRLVLQLLRDSAPPRRGVAEAGFFQSALDTSIPYQLIRVILPVDAEYFAEISAGKHRYTIRFMQQLSYDERPVQTSENIEFMLACCAL